MSRTFAEIGVRDELNKRLLKMGLSAATPIQEASIPILMSGKDLTAQAQTGTGKTLAFVLPILQRILSDKDYTQAVILAPTRELAIQITAEVTKLSPAVGASVLAVYGGQDVEAQIRKLKKAPHIVIGTPGRFLDHLRRGTLNLGRVSMLVLDEADQMLHMGFLTEVEDILQQMPSSRQTMLFSATLPDPIRRLAANYMRQPEDVRIQGKKITLEGIKQLLVETTDRAKQDTLFALLQLHRPYLSVIFCRTKIRAKKLTEAMYDAGFNVDELHGDLTQAKREQVMKKFREADLQYLVATDVAARGLDVEGVTHVINYDIPHDAETYIHRIGRTGRAGQKGMAITLASSRDRPYVLAIEKGIGMNLLRKGMEELGITPSGKVRQGTEEDHTDRKRSSFVTKGKFNKEGGPKRDTNNRKNTRKAEPGKGGPDRRGSSAEPKRTRSSSSNQKPSTAAGGRNAAQGKFSGGEGRKFSGGSRRGKRS